MVNFKLHNWYINIPIFDPRDETASLVIGVSSSKYKGYNTFGLADAAMHQCKAQNELELLWKKPALKQVSNSFLYLEFYATHCSFPLGLLGCLLLASVIALSMLQSIPPVV